MQLSLDANATTAQRVTSANPEPANPAGNNNTNRTESSETTDEKQKYKPSHESMVDSLLGTRLSLLFFVAISLLLFLAIVMNYQDFGNTRRENIKVSLPDYFSVLKRPGDIQNLLTEYVQFHTQALKSFVEEHKCEDKDHDLKFVVFTPHEYSGVGNIIMGLVPTFWYAILTKRVFLVEWKGGMTGCKASLKELFQDPVIGGMTFNWDHMDLVDKCARVKNKPASEVEKNLQKRRHHMEFTVGQSQSFPAYQYFMCTPDYYSESVSPINKQRWLEMEAAQYWAPLLYYENTQYFDLMKTMFPVASDQLEKYDKLKHPQLGLTIYSHVRTQWLEQQKLIPKSDSSAAALPELWRQFQVDNPITFFHALAKALLFPVKAIQEKVETQKRLLFGEIKNRDDVFILGIQLRKNMHENLFYRTPPNVFWNCAKENFVGKINNKRIIFLLATDFVDARKEARKYFSGPEFSDIELVYYDKPDGMSRSSEEVQNAMVDMLLLMESDDLIVTEKSTFGHVVHGYKGYNPLVVRFMEGDYAKEPKCERLKSSEPWFHLHFRASSVKC